MQFPFVSPTTSQLDSFLWYEGPWSFAEKVLWRSEHKICLELLSCQKRDISKVPLSMKLTAIAETLLVLRWSIAPLPLPFVSSMTARAGTTFGDAKQVPHNLDITTDTLLIKRSFVPSGFLFDIRAATDLDFTFRKFLIFTWQRPSLD